MHARFTGFLAALALLFLGPGAAPAEAQRAQMLQSAHYRVYYAKEHEATAGEILRLSEAVWPTLAKAYDAYDNYQIIDIFLSDRGDVANGSAIYPFSRVEIYLPHMNWVMRGRRNWLGNVLTHELAHVFSLRQKARLWIFDGADLGVDVHDPFDPRAVSWTFRVPLEPMVAPTWWVEGIAQFEAETAGQDVWDPQRDMIVRDAWLTGTLPELGEIETFDGDWVQGERTYNTGFAFLRYLRDTYGIDKVRALAFSKPWFHFGGAVRDAFGTGLPELYSEWKRSLEARYSAFPALPEDRPFDADIEGSFTQSLAFSRDGRYQAWLGNGDRIYPLNWIYWKEIGGEITGRSGQPVTLGTQATAAAPARYSASPFLEKAVPALRSTPVPLHPKLPLRQPKKEEGSPKNRSREMGSAGLEFNRDGTRLLTTRNDWNSPYSDIWEYDFLSGRQESEKWHRLTWNERASDASYHPTSRGAIVFSKFEKGSSNVAVLDSTGRIRQLTHFRGGEQVYNPRFTPTGDSIYFSLGMDGKEAIAAVAASATPWDPFAAVLDSAAFPDSFTVARGQSLRLITPLENASYRDVRFFGDTLVFSTDGRDSGYNVFARLPGDTLLRRMTRGRTQALEPVLRDGILYYQGYQRQRFGIYAQPARFEPAGPWVHPTDSLPPKRPKIPEYFKAGESREPGVRKVAWYIQPSLYTAPLFLNDSTLDDFNVYLALTAYFGPVSSGPNQYLSGYVSKSTDLHTPLNYGASYGGQWSGITTWHRRYGWTPNLGYQISRSVSHENERLALADTVPTGPFDSTHVSLKQQLKRKYTTDMLQAAMSLPLDGTRLGPGYLGVSWYGRYYNQHQAYDATQTYRERSLTDTAQPPYAETFAGRIWETSMHRHLMQQGFLQWGLGAPGTQLPRYGVLYASLSQWWTRYADVESQVLTDTNEVIGEGRPIPLIQFGKADFSPWQVDAGLEGHWSYRDRVTFSLRHHTGTFLQKFPQRVTPVKRTYDSIPALWQADTTMPNIAYNLDILPYRLYYYMAGYPYQFYYRGHDILQGTAMTWTQVSADFPLKIRQYLDYPSMLSSLNKLQLSLIGDAGTVLSRTPDKLAGSLKKGQHYLLLDFGVKLSATFLMYHGFPMEFFVQVFQPYNHLRASNMFMSDLPLRNFHTVPAGGMTVDGEFLPEGTQIVSREEDAKNREEQLQIMKEPKFRVGFTFGGF